MAIKFIFLLLPQVHILDLAGPDQTIYGAIEYGADFEIEYCGIDQEVLSTSGLPFGKVKHFSQITCKSGDFLFIPGSSYAYLRSTNFLNQQGIFQWMRQLYENGINLCSICLGAFVLAESGLLDGKNCTTHFARTKELQSNYPKIRVMENILFTEQNGIYTSAGIVSGIDLTLHIVEKLKGSHFAHLVARELVVFARRGGSDSQESDFLKFRNHIHAGIHKVQDFIYENIQVKSTLPELAELADMSERNFTRTFKKETGITVAEYINLIRIAKALEWMKNPGLSRIEIANKVGLKSDKQLGRILSFKKP